MGSHESGRKVSERYPRNEHPYRVKRLVYTESLASIDEARRAESAMKRWRRAWKIQLIEKHNPGWRDLYDDINR